MVKSAFLVLFVLSITLSLSDAWDESKGGKKSDNTTEKESKDITKKIINHASPDEKSKRQEASTADDTALDSDEKGLMGKRMDKTKAQNLPVDDESLPIHKYMIQDDNSMDDEGDDELESMKHADEVPMPCMAAMPVNFKSDEKQENKVEPTADESISGNNPDVGNVDGENGPDRSMSSSMPPSDIGLMQQQSLFKGRGEPMSMFFPRFQQLQNHQQKMSPHEHDSKRREEELQLVRQNQVKELARQAKLEQMIRAQKLQQEQNRRQMIQQYQAQKRMEQEQMLQHQEQQKAFYQPNQQPLKHYTTDEDQFFTVRDNRARSQNLNSGMHYIQDESNMRLQQQQNFLRSQQNQESNLGYRYGNRRQAIDMSQVGANLHVKREQMKEERKRVIKKLAALRTRRLSNDFELI